MLPVFMILHSKIYFMRAPARQRKYRIKELYRQTEAPQRGAIPCHISAKPKQAGQAHRSAPHKIPQESQGVYLTFLPLPAPYPRAPSLAPSGQFTLWRRGLVRRADERGVSFSVSPEPKTYPGGTESPLDECAQRTKFVIVRGFVTGGSMPALSMTLSIHAMLRPSFSMTSTPSVSCMTSPLSAPWTAFQ